MSVREVSALLLRRLRRDASGHIKGVARVGSMYRYAVIVSLLATLASLTSCGGGRDVPAGDGVDSAFSKIRAEQPIVYYLGSRFAGLPLTHAEADRSGRALFVYGTCEIPPGQTEGGCAPPIQVQVFPFAPRDWSHAVGCHRLSSLRGVPTARHDGLVLFSDRTVLKIYARTPAEDDRAALALRRVDGSSAPQERLPAPPSAVRALIGAACGTQPGETGPPIGRRP